jgi:hypothetical protein
MFKVYTVNCLLGIEKLLGLLPRPWYRNVNCKSSMVQTESRVGLLLMIRLSGAGKSNCIMKQSTVVHAHYVAFRCKWCDT